MCQWGKISLQQFWHLQNALCLTRSDLILLWVVLINYLDILLFVFFTFVPFVSSLLSFVIWVSVLYCFCCWPLDYWLSPLINKKWVWMKWIELNPSQQSFVESKFTIGNLATYLVFSIKLSQADSRVESNKVRRFGDHLHHQGDEIWLRNQSKG